MVDKFKDYIQKKIEILKIETTEKISKILGNIVFGVIIFAFLLFFIFLLSISLALLIGGAKGFVIVTAFYFLIILILLIFKKRLILNPIANVIIKNTFQKEQKNEKKEINKKS
ncbi:MAG: hypothetical protein B6I24_04520 [Bacteroidetes bacterium 4572_128]|nr:MAG: hypothetical protein B6I24_04520 [Bacteroidetes bacterium 4572_128]